MATPGSIRERLPEWCLSLEGPRKLVLNGLILIFSLLGSGVVIKAALKQVYVVDAISVPKDLEADGYTSATVGQRIIDAVSDINRVAAMTKQVGIYALSEADPSRPDSADFEGPGQTHAASALEAVVLSGDDSSAKYDVSVGGISLDTMIFYVRELFGLTDPKISGEIIAEKPAATVGKDEKPAATKYSIRLRVSDKGLVQHEGEATDRLATLFEEGALKLVERFDPLNAGYYSYYKRDYENALRIARAYLVRGTKDDEEWALNLLGMVSHARFRHDEARAQKGYDDAIASFRDLRRRYPQFAPGLYNLGVALIDKGDLLQQQDKDAAYRHYKDAREVALQGIQIEEAGGKGARGSAIGYATAGNALRSMARWEAARYDDALQYFKLSVKANPMFVYAYLSQGNIFYSRRAPEEANLSYQLATEICPSAQTFTRVGALLLQFGQNPDAVPMFQRAAELKPSPYAFTYWGMALRDSGRTDEARELFKRPSRPTPTLRTATTNSASCISNSASGTRRSRSSRWRSKSPRDGRTTSTTSVWRCAAPASSIKRSRLSSARSRSTRGTRGPMPSSAPRWPNSIGRELRATSRTRSRRSWRTLSRSGQTTRWCSTPSAMPMSCSICLSGRRNFVFAPLPPAKTRPPACDADIEQSGGT